MNSTYVFLCGVAWCQFGEEAAGSELIRALSSADSKIRVLARAMLGKAGLRSKASDWRSDGAAGNVSHPGQPLHV